MNSEKQPEVVAAVQARIAGLVAGSPAGHNLLLIGGFRYRFLNQSVRSSKDIDYHWAGDLEEKQKELISLFRKRLLPALKRDMGYEGRADAQSGPDADLPAVRTVIVALWQPGVEYSRIEIPVEVTRVPCLDNMVVKTVDGTIYPVLSDPDQIESKIIAVFNRQILQHRDLVDVFLFSSSLSPESPLRLKKKFDAVGVTPKEITKRLTDLKKNSDYHAKQIQLIIDTQIDPEAAENLNAAGGGAFVLERALELISQTSTQ